MQAAGAAVPIGNIYAMQAIADLPMPTLLLPRGIKVTQVEIGDVAGEWLEPAGLPCRKTVLYFHGGAFVLCRARTERMIAANLIKAVGGCRLFCADYAKPPAHPYPAALDSAVKTWRWLTQEQGVLASDIVVSGDSAGGNLAIALLFQLQALGEQIPSGAVLLSPWVEMLPFDSESWKSSAKYDYIAQQAMVEKVATLYAAPSMHSNPFVAPLHASPEQLRGMPPLWISVGGAEVLRSSIQEFASKVARSGGQVEVYVGGGMPHVYQLCFFAYKPPRAEQLPRCYCCCRDCCVDSSNERNLNPVWESLEQARGFIWSQKVWGT